MLNEKNGFFKFKSFMMSFLLLYDFNVHSVDVVLNQCLRYIDRMALKTFFQRAQVDFIGLLWHFLCVENMGHSDNLFLSKKTYQSGIFNFPFILHERIIYAIYLLLKIQISELEFIILTQVFCPIKLTLSNWKDIIKNYDYYLVLGVTWHRSKNIN